VFFRVLLVGFGLFGLGAVRAPLTNSLYSPSFNLKAQKGLYIKEPNRVRIEH